MKFPVIKRAESDWRSAEDLWQEVVLERRSRAKLAKVLAAELPLINTYTKLPYREWNKLRLIYNELLRVAEKDEK